jgi:RNA polymerase primary sigma factor
MYLYRIKYFNLMNKTILISTNEIQQYVKDIRKIKVISHERQDEIFECLKNKEITEQERSKLLEELVVGNLRFVITIAKLYQGQGLDIMDLISEGNIGLIKASERFNPSSGFKFISYAVWWIRQSIMLSLNENSRTIRLPSNIIQDQHKKQKSETLNNNQFLISHEDNSPDLVLPYCINLGQKINEDGDDLTDIIPDKNSLDPDSLFKSPIEIRKNIDSILSVLDDREKVIIEKSYGLTGVEMNLEDLGEEFGCTKERIRQLRDKALKKLRNESYGFLNYL